MDIPPVKTGQQLCYKQIHSLIQNLLLISNTIRTTQTPEPQYKQGGYKKARTEGGRSAASPPKCARCLLEELTGRWCVQLCVCESYIGHWTMGLSR